MCTREDRLISIRKITHADRKPIQKLLQKTDMFSKSEIEVAMELIDTSLNDPKQEDYIIYTALSESKDVLGYYCIGHTPLTQRTFDLYWIAVDSSSHNQGIGKQLLQHSESLVKSLGGNLMVAETSSQPKYENTRIFYLKNKYEEIARIKDYYKTDDDLVIYGKYVSQSGVTQ